MFPQNTSTGKQKGTRAMFILTCNPSRTVVSAEGELVETDKVKLPNGSFALGESVEQYREDRISHTADRARLPGCDKVGCQKALFKGHYIALQQGLRLMNVSALTTKGDAQKCARSAQLSVLQTFPFR
jgi:hypothetical protein